MSGNPIIGMEKDVDSAAEKDSGISSFSSENSDTNQISTLDLLKNEFEIKTKLEERNEDSEREVMRNCKLSFQGQYELSRRHTPSMIPWIVECIKLRQEEEPVMASIEKSHGGQKTVLKISTNISTMNLFQNCSKREIEYEHQINNLTRFSKNRDNPKQFSYLFRNSRDTPFTCFAYQAEDEATVNRIFYTVHSLMMSLHLWNSLDPPPSPTTPTNDSTAYQVEYIGKVVVATKKAPPTFIDEAVERFQELSRDENRKSMESDDVFPSYMKEKRGSSSSTTSYSSGSSSSSILSNSPSNKFAVPNDSLDSCNGDEDSSKGCGLKQAQLLIGQEDVFLMPQSNQDRVLNEWKFKHITFCSQGVIYCNHFGFIVKSINNGLKATLPRFTCYIFKCASESMVDEIMLSMRTAFKTYLEKSSRSVVLCQQCPLQQLNKLCQHIEGKTASERFDILSEKVNYLQHCFTFESPISKKGCFDVATLEKTNIIMMHNLIKLCQKLQLKHDHNNNKNNNKNNVKSKNNQFSQDVSYDSGVESLNGGAFKDNILLFLDDSPDDFASQDSNLTDVLVVESSYSLSSFPMIEEMDGEHLNLERLKVDRWADEVKQRRHSVPHSLPIHSPTSPRDHKKSLSPLKEGMQSPSLSAGGVKAKEKHEALVSIDKKIPYNSPIRKMFDKLGHFRSKGFSPSRNRNLKGLRNSGRSSSLSLASNLPLSSTHSSLLHPAFQLLPKHRGAWQVDILACLNNISSHHFEAFGDDICAYSEMDSTRKFHAKSAWKKAIGDTILLIKINKRALQMDSEVDAVEGLGSKVDYLEVVPDLKEVAKIWRQLLESQLWSRMKLDRTLLLKSVKEGVPKDLRGRVWKLLVRQQQLQNTHLDKPPLAIGYEVLKRQLTSHQHAILIDLGRTFPAHPFFSSASGPGQASLFSVLKAYSVLDTEVGYCQGLSFVAGVLLMHVSEQDAFELLKHLMYGLNFRRQYRTDMVPLQVRLYQLTRLLHDSYRDLFEHLEAHQIAPTLYAAPWFLTIFASQFPIGFVSRVFDLIFSHGTDVVIKAALVLLGNHKELIQQCTTLETIVDFLKTTLPEMALIQMEKIFNQVIQMDISKTLEAYEVEFHILHEELVTGGKGESPQQEGGDLVRMSRMQLVNEGLRRQKMELLEQLQSSRHHIHQLEAEVMRISSSEVKLRIEKKVLELERSALLDVIQHSIIHPSSPLLEEEEGGVDDEVDGGGGDNGGGSLDGGCVDGRDAGNVRVDVGGCVADKSSEDMVDLSVDSTMDGGASIVSDIGKGGDVSVGIVGGSVQVGSVGGEAEVFRRDVVSDQHYVGDEGKNTGSSGGSVGTNVIIGNEERCEDCDGVNVESVGSEIKEGTDNVYITENNGDKWRVMHAKSLDEDDDEVLEKGEDSCGWVNVNSLNNNNNDNGDFNSKDGVIYSVVLSKSDCIEKDKCSVEEKEVMSKNMVLKSGDGKVVVDGNNNVVIKASALK